MKKILAILCVFIFGMQCFADDMYLYRGTVIKDNYKQKAKRTKSVINLPETQPFKLFGEETTAASDASVMAAGVSNTAAMIVASLMTGASLIADPYVVQVNNNQYVFVFDKTKGKWTSADILGINDNKSERFKSLVMLDKDGDSKVTAEELKKANLRLVQGNENGVLLVKHRQYDFNLDCIDYIDLNSLSKNANSETTGIFGHFNIYLKNFPQRIAVGYVTYDNAEDLNILFE
jgi:hypothetical protein